MPRRRIPPEVAAGAVARLGAVVRSSVPGGWVPPPDALAPADAELSSESATAPGQLAVSAASAPGSTLAGAAGLVVDPGRRGVAALAVVAAVAALVAGVVVLRGRPAAVTAPTVDRPGVPMGASPAATGEVVVSVGGKVRRPGLVRLPAGSRVDDALRAAGGATAGIGLLNLARRLVDGEQVLVGVAAPQAAGTTGTSGLVDLNSATAAQLDALPGIGPVLAERIVEWRTEHGRFGSVDQLREVPGIGESKYVQLKAKVSV